ncbi:hypothetical protein N7532_001359 [Penicillium argentinense]|uniref:Transmembrane protein n=1 Tax=Penicillium argentinense TaxID=1131581 RepID=A0A9W9G2C6_9EURO|nr:uncharacterized protein N7532_001359 [Penicillium argentinense]KAJ5110824.1 hypothetical protein N7532_001359 [Penicillium argentinense]
MEETKRRQVMSRWWPGGALILAIIFFIAGGAQIKAYYSKAVQSCEADWDHGNGDYDNIDDIPNSKCEGPRGLAIGGFICIVLGFILGFAAVVLLVLHCTRRRRAQNPGVVYHSAPVTDYGYYSQPGYPQPYEPYATVPTQLQSYPAQTVPYNAPAPEQRPSGEQNKPLAKEGKGETLLQDSTERLCLHDA